MNVTVADTLSIPNLKNGLTSVTHHAKDREYAKDPPRTRQRTLILAAFRPWGGSDDTVTWRIGL